MVEKLSKVVNFIGYRRSDGNEDGGRNAVSEIVQPIQRKLIEESKAEEKEEERLVRAERIELEEEKSDS